MEFSPPKAKVDAMHVLTTQTAKDRLREAPLFQASSVPQTLADPPSMDHLDALEAQSIYILREAFARLKKLALLWSLGKDSNVMIWLARKAFFGRVPFPAMHVDTGKKFPEMYAFRDRYGKEWELDLRIEPCPPIDAVDPTLPPAARSAARKTEGLKMALAKHVITWLHGKEAADAAEEAFIKQFSRKEVPDEMPEISVGGGPHKIAPLLVKAGLASTNSEAIRKIREGAVSVDGEKLADVQREMTVSRPTVLKLGRKFARVKT